MITPAKLLRTAFLTVAVSAVCMIGASAASGVGTVNTDALRLRNEANTTSTILGTASRGDTVVILEDAGNGWYKVDYNTVEGYMSGEYLTVTAQADVAIGYGLVQTGGSTLNVRSGPGPTYSKVTSLSDNAVVTIVGINNGWYKITASGGTTGYVSSEYMVTCKDSAGSRGDGATAVAVASNSSMGQQVVAYAKQFLGVPYVYGGNGPSCFDCSGFTNYVYRHFGYVLNRGASSQLKNGTPVSKSELQPGDLVFFRYNTTYPASHCGIYIGGGQFIHASTNKYQVQIDQLLTGHYANVYIAARRIL